MASMMKTYFLLGFITLLSCINLSIHMKSLFSSDWLTVSIKGEYENNTILTIGLFEDKEHSMKFISSTGKCF